MLIRIRESTDKFADRRVSCLEACTAARKGAVEILQGTPEQIIMVMAVYRRQWRGKVSSVATLDRMFQEGVA